MSDVWNKQVFPPFILQVALFNIGSARGSNPRNADLDETGVVYLRSSLITNKFLN